MMTDPLSADDLLTALISGTDKVPLEGFAELTDEHERDKALRVLLAMLTDPNPRLRERATRALEVLKDRRAVAALIESLEADERDFDMDRDLFDTKLDALVALGDPSAILPLVTHNMNGNYLMVNSRLHEFDREAMMDALTDAANYPKSYLTMIHALGQIGDSRGASIVIRGLNNDSFNIRRESIKSIVKMKAVDAVPSLMGCTQDYYAQIRGPAAEALGILGDEQAIPALLPLLNDEVHRVRFDAAFALGKLGDASGAELIREYLAGDSAGNPLAINETLKAFQRLGLSDVSLLVDLADRILAHVLSRYNTLMLIAEIFAQHGDPSALPVLDRILAIERVDTGIEFLDRTARAEYEATRLLSQQAIDRINAQRGGKER